MATAEQQKQALNAVGPVLFEDRNSVLDDDFAGEKMPKRLSLGPVPKRSMTDIICCLIFLLVIIGFFTVGILFSVKSTSGSVTNVMDSSGNLCGVDTKVANYPYLYIYKFDARYRSVCVKECPKFDYNQIKNNANGKNTASIDPLYFESYSSVVKTTSRFGLSGGRNAFDYDPNFAQGYYTKEQWYSYLNRFQVKCYPNNEVANCGYSETDGNWVYDSRANFGKICTPLVSSAVSAAGSSLSNVNVNWIFDLIQARWMILISALLALLCAIVVLAISNCLIDIIVWILAIFAVLMLCALAVFFAILGFGDHSAKLKSNNFSASTVKSYEALLAYKWWFIFALWVTLLIMIGFVTYLILNRKALSSSARIIEVSYCTYLSSLTEK
jgi:hypothetical protein